jgi:hypothetical protein
MTKKTRPVHAGYLGFTKGPRGKRFVLGYHGTNKRDVITDLQDELWWSEDGAEGFVLQYPSGREVFYAKNIRKQKRLFSDS